MTPEELITSKEQTRAGFVAMALEKNMMAVPFVQEAKALRSLAAKVRLPRELLERDDLFAGLLAASGLSTKALTHLTANDKKKAIENLIDNFLEPTGKQFADELVYRYLLTKGDALGGQARNLAGMLGDRKFFRTLISVLNLAGIKYRWKDLQSGVWLDRPDDDSGIEKNIKALFWSRKRQTRLLITRSKLPLIGKNVDLILFDASPEDFHGNNLALFRHNARYVALGELKGGVDPAGADEHWKTANFALSRIKSGFQSLGLNPHTFFVGAAIAQSMAEEICRQIDSRVLERAANLSNDDQLASLCEWLVSL